MEEALNGYGLKASQQENAKSLIHHWVEVAANQADGAVAVPKQAETSLSFEPVGMERRCVLNSWSKEEVRAVIHYEWAAEYQKQKFITASGSLWARCDVEANGAEMVSHIQ
ncbi:hypothetical protein TNIN_410481 [Trichonephila inaurata madagascariensis]|uniref:Uncharacterized protein n=1 Tax=Trichonephila inaurata madagascariensis TaxID=2747483 RepID=A0A8X6MHX8_9ARAC|nr:hypothetical protein TNIN_410481 [Trichonephila inaurata madagascariensis]